jgi:hypothetical protein
LKQLILLLAVLCSNLVFAESGKIIVLRGKASFNNQPLMKNTVIKGKGILTTSEKSLVKIQFSESGGNLLIGPRTSADLDLTVQPELMEVSLVKGIARWVTGNRKVLGIKTSNAVMGVRGTDFLASFNPLLGESEVVCFEGAVQLTNAQDISDSKLIAKNQWGGIGGRFGSRLSSILTLSEEVIKVFEDLIPHKTTGQ